MSSFKRHCFLTYGNLANLVNVYQDNKGDLGESVRIKQSVNIQCSYLGVCLSGMLEGEQTKSPEAQQTGWRRLLVNLPAAC